MLTHDAADERAVLVAVEGDVGIVHVDQDASSRWPLRVVVTLVDDRLRSNHH